MYKSHNLWKSTLAVDELVATSDRLSSSLRLQRQSFNQQIRDADQLINQTADELCRCVDNERRRLLLETAAIHRNTLQELDQVCDRHTAFGAHFV